VKVLAKIILIISTALLILIAGCSKDKPAEPEYYISGYITLYNTALDGYTGYAIYITDVMQRRGDIERSRSYNSLIIYPGGRRTIENIIDGGTLFPGGDDVTVRFESAYQPTPGNPFFEGSVTLTVNGTQNIRIKGHDGTYDISGN
jgi:hypothetical protein